MSELEIVDELDRPERPERPPRQGRAEKGSQVVVIWEGPDEHDDWTPAIPGSVEEVSAQVIARKRDEYRELAALRETRVPVIFLNEEFAPLKSYIAARQRELASDHGADRARNGYAVGVGVGLIVLDREINKAAKAGKKIDEESLAAAKQALARATLSVLPAFDDLAREAGIDT